MRDHALLSLNCEDCIGLSFVFVTAVCGINCIVLYCIVLISNIISFLRFSQCYNCKTIS